MDWMDRWRGNVVSGYEWCDAQLQYMVQRTKVKRILPRPEVQ